MSYKFAEYEIVKFNRHDCSTNGAVRGWDSEGEIYDVRLPDETTLQISENDLETTHEYETPFRFFEVVEIHPLRLDDEPALTSIMGKRGVITGVSSSTQSGYWGFAVDVQNGECWYLEENELKSINVILSEEELFGPNEGMATIRLQYNSLTEKQTILEGDVSLLKRGPIPLRIDLESL